jgi:hypothetical protein
MKVAKRRWSASAGDDQPQPWELKRQRIRPLAGSIEYSRPSKASSKTLP